MSLGTSSTTNLVKAFFSSEDKLELPLCNLQIAWSKNSECTICASEAKYRSIEGYFLITPSNKARTFDSDHIDACKTMVTELKSSRIGRRLFRVLSLSRKIVHHNPIIPLIGRNNHSRIIITKFLHVVFEVELEIRMGGQ